MPTTAMTSDQLAERVDPAIAVERALTAREEGVFLEHVLVGGFQGARPADWLDEADNADAYCGEIDAWWEESGDTALAYLLTLHELPERLTRRILATALTASIAITRAGQVGAWRRTHIEIASGACLFARGYGEALGWTPHQDGS